MVFSVIVDFTNESTINYKIYPSKLGIHSQHEKKEIYMDFWMAKETKM